MDRRRPVRINRDHGPGR